MFNSRDESVQLPQAAQESSCALTWIAINGEIFAWNGSLVSRRGDPEEPQPAETLAALRQGARHGNFDALLAKVALRKRNRLLLIVLAFVWCLFLGVLISPALSLSRSADERADAPTLQAFATIG